VPVEKFLGGISRFQKHVYPKHQDLFERLAMGQRPEVLFITCADSQIPGSGAKVEIGSPPHALLKLVRSISVAPTLT
jgi:carbonic anhydrase